MAERDAIEIKIGNDIVVGLLPRLPLRQLLRRSYQRALGYTSDADREALDTRKAGDPMPEPSEEEDPYAVACVLVAVIGCCWPNKLDCPSLAECRHDVVTYGEGALEALVAKYGDTPEIGKVLANTGRELLYEMIGIRLRKLKEAVENEAVFTGDPGQTPSSTGG